MVCSDVAKLYFFLKKRPKKHRLIIFNKATKK